MKKLFFGLVFLVVLAIAGVFGLVMYTPVPLKGIASLLEQKGVHIEGLDGNLASGYSFTKLSFEDEELDLKMENVKFSYTGFIESTLDKKFIIEDMTVGKYHAIFKTSLKEKFAKNGAKGDQPAQGKPRKAKPADPQAEAQLAELKAKWKAGEILREYGIRNLHVTDVLVSSPDMPQKLEIKEITVKNMLGTPSDLDLGEAKFVSSLFDLSAKGLHLDGKVFVAKQPMNVVVRAGAWKGIKRDVDFRLSGSYIFAKGQGKADLSALGDHLKIRLSQDLAVDVETKNLTLADYFEGAPEIRDLNLRAPPGNVAMFLLGAVPFQGDFTYAGRLFTIAPPETPAAGTQPDLGGALFAGVHEDGPFKYRIGVHPSLGFLLGSPTPWLEVSTNQEVGAGELLSRIHYKKHLDQATPEEKTALEAAVATITVGKPVLPLYASPRTVAKAAPKSAPKTMVMRAPPKAPSRAPASAPRR